MPSKEMYTSSVQLTPRIRGLLETLAEKQSVKLHRTISSSAVMRALISHASTQPNIENAIRTLVTQEFENGRKWGRPKKIG